MWPNPQFPADLVTFPEETLNEKLHLLCSSNPIYWRFLNWTNELNGLTFSGKIDQSCEDL